MSKKKKKEETPETEDAEAKPTEGQEGEEGEGAPKKGKKKLVFIAGGVVLLLVIVGGLFAAGVIGGGGEDAPKEKTPEEIAHEEAAAKAAAAPIYYELPQFLVNLNSASGRASFLKISVTIQLRDQEGVATMDANKPRIVDTFNTYLRELRPTDIQGSAGIYRLRNELLTRLNSTIEDGVAKDILFGEIIVQ